MSGRVGEDGRSGRDAEPSRRQRAAAVATLVRVPNLFTAPPDIVLGAALAAGAGTAVDPVTVVGLAVASMLLYAGGTALNDAFDAPRDATERPERPIPSGEVSRGAAFGLGGAFLAVGVAVASASSGVAGGAVGLAVAAGIVLYDGALKGGALGFLTMGAVRGANVVLGRTAGGEWTPPRWFLPAVAVAAYVAAVTFMAERETEGGNRPAVAVAAGGAGLAVVLVGAHLTLVDPGTVAAVTGGALAVAFLAWTGSRLLAAYRNPVPETVGPAVGICVLGIVVLDAAFAAAAGPRWGVAALAFLLPSMGLARVFDVT